MGSQSDAFNSQLLTTKTVNGKGRSLILASACSFAAMSLACGVGSAHAAENSINTLLEEVEVVARKRGDAERLQDVPVAATAYSGDQLEALQTRDLESLAFKMPNVQMDDAGTIKSTANFTVRGLGVNSSIPSIDPTVGVFVDGMYMGINAGVILDLFDLEGIEVLRGPQGLLFGRNVTGGAVVVKTAKPTEEFMSKVRFSTTAQEETNLAATVSGQISESVNGRLTAYYSDDKGWFENKANGNDNLGASTTWFVRPSFTVEMGESADLIVRLESGHVDADGPVGQNRGDFSPAIAASVGVTNWDNSDDSFEVAIDNEGWAETDWNQAIAEYNQDVAFGNGTITNILAWRDYDTLGEGDIDSLPVHLFHSYSLIDQEQLSNELRYSGRFGATSITSGVYWFSQDLKYIEERNLLGGALVMAGGGVQDHTAKGVFTQADIDLNESWVLTLGGRYSSEEKTADIASIIPGNGCDREGCAVYDFSDTEEWSAFTPKVGMQWLLSDTAQAYAVWTKGFRSGGYNMRNTAFGESPGPTDQEEQNSFEIGAKSQWLDGRVKTNMAVFHNTIDDMQREVNLPSATAGVAQLIRNTANATIRGAEFEMMAGLSDSLLMTMNLGYVDGEYDDIWLDLTGDGVVDGADYALDIPRLAPWTYGVGMVHDLQLGSWGALTSRINYNHRDASAYTDNNAGMLSEVEMVDFSIGFTPDSGNYRLALFGKNMLDEVSEGNDTQLPGMLGPVTLGPNSTFTPINRGRIVGIELNYEI
ncbi:TonB-dependent receptor [Microbulbifer hydrolyticus]|uniref:Iron complex outermembrane receptor protein n=1 Tax=Microbulbifer hydrolyticus TaxID=48074 RepID=A0A6P1TC43_9GAMM|nr:TonB-dependent receptor [Microbulbifer hydrolyticus]MBB5209894.1 iron complex outermembrane receptor protein [Microbulbifer hydrolyticus]QHQ39567.1 TonB-dependent receptor [Microbulbifer hydrolyticus]